MDDITLLSYLVGVLALGIDQNSLLDQLIYDGSELQIDARRVPALPLGNPLKQNRFQDRARQNNASFQGSSFGGKRRSPGYRHQ